jgi:hypothetical protein
MTPQGSNLDSAMCDKQPATPAGSNKTIICNGYKYAIPSGFGKWRNQKR